MQKVGTCKNCGGNELEVAKGIYTCKSCKHIGSTKEWLTKKPK